MIIKQKKDNQIVITLKSFSLNILKYYLNSFFFIIKNKDYFFKMQPTQQKRITVLRSPHKYKKAQEHFNLQIFKANLSIKSIKLSEIMLLLTNKPKGVTVKFKIKQVKFKE